MKSNEQQSGYVLTLSEENYSLVIDALSYYAFTSVKDTIRDAAQKLHDDLFDMKLMIERANTSLEVVQSNKKCCKNCVHLCWDADLEVWICNRNRSLNVISDCKDYEEDLYNRFCDDFALFEVHS